ncbi:hypothetical protein F4861DRAFT_527056 [Xylaria intraflava]|nr:hypothetical protein F4861DRAFT_527056 [Xylaria intraflava]
MVLALEAELNLYKEEMGTLQKLWDDLQTQHVELQKRLEDEQKNRDAREECETDKANLQQKLDDANQSIHALKLKVFAEPSKLQPAIIELEAQRNAARQRRLLFAIQA